MRVYDVAWGRGVRWGLGTASASTAPRDCTALSACNLKSIRYPIDPAINAWAARALRCAWRRRDTGKW
jgi:hypothetical protein